MKQFLIRHWPRGKYNGQPIVGLKTSLTIDLWYWKIKPDLLVGDRALYADCWLLIRWLCFTFRLSAEYSFSHRD